MTDPLILRTERLKLTPFAMSDGDLLFKTLTDPFIRKYLWDDEEISQETNRKILGANQKYFKERQLGLWKIIHRKEKYFIGFCGLWYFFDESQPQLVYGLLPAHTKMGFAAEASSAVIDYAFDKLGFSYLTASCDAAHQDSRNVATRVGMRFLEEKEMNGKPTAFYQIGRQ